MDTDATDEQRALLEVSTRFMEDACPLRAVRDGAWKDDEFAATYRRQAAELGWYSMLVPEALGGGSVSGNGVLDAALIAYAAWPAAAARLVRRHQRRRPRRWPGPAATSCATPCSAACWPARSSASWAVASAGDGGRLDGGVDAAAAADGGLELTGAKTAVQDVDAGVVAARHVRSDADGPTQALVAADAPGVTVTELDSLDITRRFAEVRFDGATVAGVGGRRHAGRRTTCSPASSPWRARSSRPRSVGAMDHDFEMTRAVRQGPHRLRPPDRLVPGRQAPAGRHQPGARDEQGRSRWPRRAPSAPTTTTDRRRPAWPRRSSATPASSWSRPASRSSAASGTRGSTTSTCTCAASRPTPGCFGDAAWHREHLCQLAGL